ncbi:GFA family protein [Maricaulis sp.]|uniref:GFA family protein n=1 Tax=Maricaulis sp. TaxID=1486257 RepID=UPI003A94959A
MMEGQCHCGAVRWTLTIEPDWLTRCNCSYCRRAQALWAYADASQVTLDYRADGVVRYLQGDRTLAFISCKACGCTTHWEGADPAAGGRMAVNANMAEPSAIEGLRIRHFDGADSWEYLDQG